MGAMVRPAPEPAAGPAEEKAAAVRRMFSAIAPRYDLLNHLLSLNVDRWWRRRAVRRLLDGREARGRFLDACAGTFDLALALAGRRGFRGRVIAFDFAWPMLQHGLPKLERRPVHAACADALRLPFGDAVFDGATIGFGLRNLADIDAGLRELARTLKPGGRLVILEFTTPERGLFRAMYLLYFRRILPWIGRVLSRHRDAYSYLPDSVSKFPAPAELAERMRAAGFGRVGWELLTGGIAALHVGERGSGGVSPELEGR